jgi:capsular polysaccharide transport system permease protein
MSVSWPGLPDRGEDDTKRLRRGFAVQGRVVHALLLRELQTRFGRGGLGFLWLFLEPLLLGSAIGLLKYVLDRGHTGNVPVFLFAITGYAPYFAFRAVIGRASGAFASNMTLMYHRQVHLIDIMAARTLLEIGAVMAILVIVVGGAAWWADIKPNSVPTLVGGVLLLFLYAHGIAMLVAAGSAVSELAERMVHPVLYISLPFSGALFTMHSLPPSLRAFMLWNPQVHFHEMVRDGMFGDMIPAYYDLQYMTGFAVGMNLLGMMAMRAIRPKLEF